MVTHIYISMALALSPRTLSLLDDFEFGIILQATDKLVAGFIKPFP